MPDPCAVIDASAMADLMLRTPVADAAVRTSP